MRSSRFLMLALAAVTLAGCMQSGGPGPFSRNAPPLWQQDITLPAMLRPGATRTAQPVIVAQPGVVAQPLPGPMGPQADHAASRRDGRGRGRVLARCRRQAAGRCVRTGRLERLLCGRHQRQHHDAADRLGAGARPDASTDLQAAIGAKLRQGYVREPHVAVEVEAYRPFFILGEVTLPGQYPYVSNMTVETAVAIAGGYSPRAQKHQIEISRQMNGLTEKRVVSPNYPVRPGDTIKVAERWF